MNSDEQSATLVRETQTNHVTGKFCEPPRPPAADDPGSATCYLWNLESTIDCSLKESHNINGDQLSPFVLFTAPQFFLSLID